MKKVLLALAIGASTMFAQADSYLYWMLAEAPSTTSSGYSPQPSFDDYAVRVYDGQKYLTFGNSDETFAYAESGQSYSNLLVSDPTVQSFMIELWNDPDANEASYRTSYINMASYIRPASEHALSGMMVAASQFHSVPEPTSGMMFLLGTMLLGLRRKKVA